MYRIPLNIFREILYISLKNIYASPFCQKQRCKRKQKRGPKLFFDFFPLLWHISSDTHILKFLFSEGFETQPVNKNGFTPLHISATP